MKAFAAYVKILESLVTRATQKRASSALNDEVAAALDGQASAELRRVVDLQTRRSGGVFFTGAAMANRVLRPVVATLDDRSVIFDPACGAGDLLVACARHLPVGHDCDKTLALWGRRVFGRELHVEFVQAAKRRLALAAWEAQRGCLREGLVQAELFPGITTGCGLADMDVIRQATHVVLNPPYSKMTAPEDCTWGGGGVSAAACFLDHCVTNARVGTHIVAILPDVLRSGERYRRWRERIEQRTSVERIQLLGQFDRWTDVDVFALQLCVVEPNGKKRVGWVYPQAVSSETVADHFIVSVGTVVPFRHAHRGPRLRYIHPRVLAAWGTDTEASEYRRFTGTTYEPPFIVVRRTSRQGDPHRAIGTIITGRGPVAVENHLLVLRPRDGTVRSCRHLLRVLRSPQTDKWFDQRLRCRHLTVAAMIELPWWEEAS